MSGTSLPAAGTDITYTAWRNPAKRRRPRDPRAAIRRLGQLHPCHIRLIWIWPNRPARAAVGRSESAGVRRRCPPATDCRLHCPPLNVRYPPICAVSRRLGGLLSSSTARNDLRAHGRSPKTTISHDIVGDQVARPLKRPKRSVAFSGRGTASSPAVLRRSVVHVRALAGRPDLVIMSRHREPARPARWCP